jgi:DNA-binding transcriptional regulator YhcF (GntR family)
VFHFNTVAIAYRMLADEGWLELKRRRGAAVIARNAPRSMDRTRVDQLLQQLSQHRRGTAERRYDAADRSRRRCNASRKEHDHDL